MKKFFLTAFIALTALAASAKSYVVFSGDPLKAGEEQISMGAFNNWNASSMEVSDYQADATSPDGKSVKFKITANGTWSGGGYPNNGFDMSKIKALSPLKLRFQYKLSEGSTTSWRFKFVDCTPEVEYEIPGLVNDGQWHEMEIDVNQANSAWGPALSSSTYWVLTIVGQGTKTGDTFELTDVRFTDGDEVVSADPKVGVTASTSDVTETSAILNYNITGTNVPDGTTYDVTVAVDGTNVATLNGVSAGANTYELTNLTAGTAYSVKVTATATVDGNAVSGQATASLKTTTPPPSTSVDTWVVFSGDALGVNEYQIPLGSFDNWNAGNMSMTEGTEGDGKSVTFTITGTNEGWAGAGWFHDNSFDITALKSDALKLMFSYKATGKTRWIIKFTGKNNAPEVEVDVPGLQKDGQWHDAVINVPSAAAAWFGNTLPNNNVKHDFAVVGLDLEANSTFTVSNVRYTVGDGSSTPDTKDPFVKVTASVTNISDNSATLNYNITGTNVPSGTNYAVTVTVNGKENQFSNISAGANTLTLPGLTEGTTYNIKVAATAIVDGNAVTGEAATSFTTTKPSPYKVGNVWRGTVKLTASSDASKTATIDYEVTAIEGGNVTITGIVREGLPSFDGLVKQLVVNNQFYDLAYNAAENELSYTTSGKNFVLGESKVQFMFRFAYAGGIFTETTITDYVYGAANEVARTPYVVLTPRISEITANSAKVGYVVEVKNAPVGTTYKVTVNGTEVTENPYLLTNLQPETEQTVVIKAVAVVDGKEYSAEATEKFTTIKGEAFYLYNAVETAIGSVKAIAEVKVYYNTDNNKVEVSGNLHTERALTRMQPLYLNFGTEAQKTMSASTASSFAWHTTCTSTYSKGADISKLQFFVVCDEGTATIQFPAFKLGDTSEDRHANQPKEMTVTFDNTTAFKVGESRPYTVTVKDGYGFTPLGKKVEVKFTPEGVFRADGSNVTALKGGSTVMGVKCGDLEQTFNLEAKTGYTAEVVFTNEPRTINNMNVNVITMTPSLLIDEMPVTEGQASAFKLMLDGVEVSTGIAPVHGFELRTGGEFSYVSGDVTVPVTVKWPQIGAAPEVKSVLYWEDDASKALDATDFYVNADYLLGPAVNPGNYHWIIKDERGTAVNRWKNGWVLHYQPQIGRKTGDVVTLIEGISLPAYEVVYPYAVRRQAPAAAQGMRRAAADDSEFEVRYARGIMPEGSNTVAPIVTSEVPEAFKPTSGSVSGVEGVTVEGAAAEYYTLDGIRIDGEHLAPGVYIRRHGTRTTKVMVK